MKKFISYFMALTMCITALCFADYTAVFAAASGTCGTKAMYNYDEATKTLTISGTGATKDYLAGNTSLNRVPWYSYRDTCENIVIEEGITEIGNYSFYKMTAVKNISMPSTLTTLASYSFDNMTALETLVLGSGVTTIEMNAFRYCSSLKNIVFNDKLESIGIYAFSECTALTSVTFPDSLTDLGGNVTGYAFSDCPNLATVTYGNGMTSTGLYAFYNSGVKNINFSDSITTVDAWSFYGCSATTLEIPANVTDLNVRCFANMFSLHTVYIYNRECNFNGIIGEDPFNGSQQNLTIYGYSQSTAQAYAEEKGYNFISLDNCAHSTMYDVIIAEADCENDGSKEVYCEICGDYIRTEVIPALGHSYETLSIDDKTEEGGDGHSYEYQQCTLCGKENTVYTHSSWVEGYYETASTATCEKGGFETRTCTICGRNSLPIPVLAGGHKIDSYFSVIEATCTENGTRTGICTVCGEIVTETISATGHTEELTASYSTEDGHTYNTYTCTVCGEVREETVHDAWVEGYYTSETVSPATCTSNGRIEHVCQICGELWKETVYMTAHSRDEGVVTKEPTCTEAGTKTYTCLNCGDELNIPVTALGHDYSVETVLREPTCTVQGTASRSCSRCGVSSTFIISALGHNIDDAEDLAVVTEPTCTENGIMQGTCANCNEVAQVEIAALGHDFDDENAVVTTEPACTEQGVLTAYCTRCDATDETSIPAKGHSYQCTGASAGSYTDYMYMNYKCKDCSETTIYAATLLLPMFSRYMNSATADVTNGYLYDVNNDGVINMRDYVIISKAA